MENDIIKTSTKTKKMKNDIIKTNIKTKKMNKQFIINFLLCVSVLILSVVILNHLIGV